VRSTLTVNRLIALFKTTFGEEGSNRRREQEITYRAFLKYVREVFGKLLKNVFHVNNKKAI